MRGPGREYGTPVSGWQQRWCPELKSRTTLRLAAVVVAVLTVGEMLREDDGIAGCGPAQQRLSDEPALES